MLCRIYCCIVAAKRFERDFAIFMLGSKYFSGERLLYADRV
jgi:hypothetical protein